MVNGNQNSDLKNKKILVIEDDKHLDYLLTTRLRKEGFNFDLAFDAESGLEKLKAQGADLILLDIILPGMNGFEFLEKIKADPRLAEIPVLIVSNLGQPQEIERGRQLGAIDFLVKANVDLDEIVAKINHILLSGSKVGDK